MPIILFEGGVKMVEVPAAVAINPSKPKTAARALKILLLGSIEQASK